MDGYGTGKEHGEALDRIVATLLSLAALAERACGRSHAIRLLIVWILRPAERAARDFVMHEIDYPAAITRPALTPDGVSSDSRAEAMRLALCFRALAMAIKTMLRQTAARLGRTGSRNGRAAKTPLLTLANRPNHTTTAGGRRRQAGRARDRPASPICVC